MAYLPIQLMTTVHAIGLPWWSVLPVSAFLVRTFIVLPFFQIPRRRDIARMALLQPLLDARMSLYTRYSLRTNSHRAWGLHRLAILKQRIWYGYYLANYWKIRNRIIKRFGGVVALAIFSEGIRRLCGVKEGLISMFLSPWAHVLSSLDQYQTSASKWIMIKIHDLMVALTGNPLLSEEGLKWAEERDETSEEQPEEESAKDRKMQWFEPSLQNEGLFFCKDLTKRDESMILPFLFVGSFAASIVFAPRADVSVYNPDPQTYHENRPAWDQASPDEIEDYRKSAESQHELFGGLTFLQRIMLTFSCSLILPALQMPSALLLYFISNIGIGAFQTRMLARAIPIRIAPRACGRPVRRNPHKIKA